MTLEHLSFVEAVERLAAKAGMQVQYAEAGPALTGPPQGQRQRLVAANAAAAEFYIGQLGTAGAGWPASSWPSAASTRRRPRRTAAGSRPTRPAHAAFMDGLRVDAERARDTLNELFAAAELAGDERSFYRARLIWIELMIEQDPTQTMDAGLAKAEEAARELERLGDDENGGPSSATGHIPLRWP